MWAWQWSDYVQLRYRPSLGAKEHMNQVSSRYPIFTQVIACTNRRTDRYSLRFQFVSSSCSFRYINITPIVSGDTNNNKNWMNKTNLLSSNMLRKYKNIFITHKYCLVSKFSPCCGFYWRITMFIDCLLQHKYFTSANMPPVCC